MKPYIFNLETTKIELHFEKSEYAALTTDQKADLKSAFLWSRTGSCWVSRAKEPNLWWAKQVAAKLGFTEEQREGERLSFSEQVERQADRAERRAERYEQYAENAERRGAALQQPLNRMHGDIAFFTQPIIAGHAGSQAFARRREKMFAHTFTEPDNLFVDCCENPKRGGGFVDFHGNRNEVSAAFHYRIYDMALIERIRTAVTRIIERSRENSILTKQELRVQLQQGHTLNDLLAFGPGQDCEIFKADKFYPGDVVVYIPDVALNHIPLDRQIKDPEELEEVLSQCYTGQDFIDECHGDTEKAERLFCYCNWQHPSSAVDELADDGEES